MTSTNNSKNSQSRIKHLSANIFPYRFHLIVFLLVASWPGLIPEIKATAPTIQCDIPDKCFFGYAPLDVLNWYEFIGDDGRLQYLRAVALDLFVLIPMYSLVLFQELYLALPNNLSDTVFSCLPFLATMFDLVETTTHGYGVAVLSLGHPSLMPSESWLAMVSICTKVKFAVLGIVLGTLVFCWCLNLSRNFIKRKQH